jgi:hypothetical protein
LVIEVVSRQDCAHVSGNDTPPIAFVAPDACISERPSEVRTFERAGHLHAHAHDGDFPESLDSFFARHQTRDSNKAAPVGVEIILLAVDGAVGAGENERVVDEPIELAHIAGELRLAKRCLAGV